MGCSPPSTSTAPFLIRNAFAMTATLFWGCHLLAFGAPLSLVFGWASRRSALLLVLLAGASAWFVALLAASLVWWTLPPLRGAPVLFLSARVMAAEAARILLLFGFELAERTLDPSLINDFAGAAALGLGFGFMGAVTGAGGALAASGGAGAWYRPGCDAMNAHALTAASALLQSAFHLAAMPAALDAWRRLRTSKGGNVDVSTAMPLVSVAALHVVFALAPLLNGFGNDACVGVLPAQLLAVLGATVLTARAVGASDYTGKSTTARAKYLNAVRASHLDTHPQPVPDSKSKNWAS